MSDCPTGGASLQRARPYGSHKEAAAQVGGMSKPLPTRYRPTNWSAYDAALRKRGSLLAGLDWQMTGPAPNEGRPPPPGSSPEAPCCSAC